jgi:hypothetical protein
MPALLRSHVRASKQQLKKEEIVLDESEHSSKDSLPASAKPQAAGKRARSQRSATAEARAASGCIRLSGRPCDCVNMAGSTQAAHYHLLLDMQEKQQRKRAKRKYVRAGLPPISDTADFVFPDRPSPPFRADDKVCWRASPKPWLAELLMRSFMRAPDVPACKACPWRL